jgi:site-specific recombinase XerD
MSKLDPLIEGYLSYLLEVGRKSPRTVIDVRCTLGRAIKGLAARRPQVPLWRLDLQDYLHWLGAERETGRASTSIAKDVSHIRGMLEYAWRSGRSERNVLDGFSVQHTLRPAIPKSLTLEEAEQLVRSCPRGNRAERRKRLMILLLYGCGLRTRALRTRCCAREP